MKKLMIILTSLLVSACGYSSRDNEMIGQVKKVMKNTPLICVDFNDADISLGVMRGGVGSISTQDVWVYVPDAENFKILKEANESGALVKVTYDVKRFTFCVNNHVVTKVEILK